MIDEILLRKTKKLALNYLEKKYIVMKYKL